MAEEFSSEEAEVYADLAERAGVVARRILAERGLVYLDDLDPEAAREVLRTAWRCAAEDPYPVRTSPSCTRRSTPWSRA